MNASVQLFELYDQWKHLTNEEGAAILASNWIEVHRCQQDKQKLQPEIARVSDQVENTSEESDELRPRLRERINELIQLETSNNDNLGNRLQSARQEKEKLDSTSQRLRKIHKSYVPAQDPVWNGRA
jgi:regulator of replication initiation timing